MPLAAHLACGAISGCCYDIEPRLDFVKLQVVRSSVFVVLVVQCIHQVIILYDIGLVTQHDVDNASFLCTPPRNGGL